MVIIVTSTNSNICNTHTNNMFLSHPHLEKKYLRWFHRLAPVVKRVAGWWLTYPNLKKIYDFVSWDDDIPNIWKNTSHVPNHQPGYH